MKPVILVVLVVVALYTYSKKDFGQFSRKELSPFQKTAYSLCICLVIGFYDGFIGPGAGSFFGISIY